MKNLKNILLCLVAIAAVACSNPCKDVDCQNGGTCDEGDCECPIGYSGNSCQIENRDGFVGIWIGNIACDGGDSELSQMIIGKSTAADNMILVDDNEATVTSPTTFVIDDTKVIGNVTITTTGEGTLDGSSLNVTTSTEVVGGLTTDCDFDGLM